MASYSVAQPTISAPTHTFFILSDLFLLTLFPFNPPILHTTHYTLHATHYTLLHYYTSLFKSLHIHKMDATTQAQPLADRSTNTHLTSASDKTDLKGSDISSMEYHRQVLQGKVTSEE